MRCKATRQDGEQCDAPDALVRGGWCQSHGPGATERMTARAKLGGQATAAKHATEGFAPEELTPIESLEDALQALDQIRVAVLTRRITHSEGGAASRAVGEWVRTHGARLTQALVTELQGELNARTKEIDDLRKQLAKASRLKVG